MFSKLCFFLFFFFIVITSNFDLVLTAKRCYKCSSAMDPSCKDPFTGTSQQCVSTTSDEINCLKYVYVLNGTNITYRGCRAQQDSCDDVIGGLKVQNINVLECCVCGGDLCTDYSDCSNATSIEISFLTFVILFIMLKVFN